jgi:predicted Zn finger-like uncharacterized protein
MHVNCPSCKFGGTVRDDQIPSDGKEVYCPNCNMKFRIKKNPSFQTTSQQTHGKAAVAQTDESEYLPISCPICGFEGKLRRSAAVTSQSKKFTCPSCKNPFTFTQSDTKTPPRDDTVPTDAPTETPSSCPGCGSRITHTLPICPSCGKILTGIRIYCPSCKSTNVGIDDKTHNNGTTEWETVIFRPVSLPVAKQADIHIPLSCRDCGKTWMIQPALIQTIGKPSVLPDRKG